MSLASPITRSSPAATALRSWDESPNDKQHKRTNQKLPAVHTDLNISPIPSAAGEDATWDADIDSLGNVTPRGLPLQLIPNVLASKQLRPTPARSSPSGIRTHFSASAPETSSLEFPELFHKYLKKADTDFEAKSYQSACNMYGKLIGMQPDNPDFFCLRAACFMRMHMYSLALADADLALDLDPEFAEACFIKAECLLRLHYVPQALNHYERCVELDPTNIQYAITLRLCQKCFDAWSNAVKVEAVKLFDKETEMLSRTPPRLLRPRHWRPEGAHARAHKDDLKKKILAEKETVKATLPPLVHPLKNVLADTKAGSLLDRSIVTESVEVLQTQKETEKQIRRARRLRFPPPPDWNAIKKPV